MKTLEKKLYDDGIVSYADKGGLSEIKKIALISLLSLCGVTTSSAQTQLEQTQKDLVETVSDSTKTSKSTKEIWFWDAINLGEDESEWVGEIIEGKPGIEPDLPDKPTSPEEGGKPEPVKDSPTKFSIESWVWYSIWWKAFRWNRVVWSWTLFKGQKWETNFFWFIDLDSPLESKWCGKITLSKSLYKWISLEWDYTFTWTGTNIARFGFGYGGKMWDGSYKVVAYPLNTNWSPIAAKVQFWKKFWKNGRLDSFVFVDFGKHSYISETEYAHYLARWIAWFIQLRLNGKFDGKFTGDDTQGLVCGLKFDIK